MAPQRWSNKDVTTFLIGMIIYHTDTGTSPYEDFDRFFDRIKGAFGEFVPSRFQVLEKIRALKRKFRDKTFSEEHVSLAESVWGVGGFAHENNVVVKNVSREDASEELTRLREQVKDLQTKLSEKEELLTSTELQLSDTKVKLALADKQAARAMKKMVRRKKSLKRKRKMKNMMTKTMKKSFRE